MTRHAPQRALPARRPAPGSRARGPGVRARARATTRRVAVPAAELPRWSPSMARTSRAQGVLSSKGLVPAARPLPTAYVAERTRVGPGRPGGPPTPWRRSTVAPARPGREGRCLRPPDPTRSPPPTARRPHTDVIGVELAGAPTPPRSPPPPPARRRERAGAAAGWVFAEIDASRAATAPGPRRSRAWREQAIVATVLAEGSRNRRAGELLAQGMPPIRSAPRSARPPRPSRPSAARRPPQSRPSRRSGALGAGGIIDGTVDERWTQSLMTAPKPGAGKRRGRVGDECVCPCRMATARTRPLDADSPSCTGPTSRTSTRTRTTGWEPSRRRGPDRADLPQASGTSRLRGVGEPRCGRG
jgi:hypothetical protein